MPKTPGIYVWCARAPDARQSEWFTIYLGKANKLRDRLGSYINTDDTFGPKQEAHKMAVLKEMYEKGFDFQIRSGPSCMACCAGKVASVMPRVPAFAAAAFSRHAQMVHILPTATRRAPNGANAAAHDPSEEGAYSRLGSTRTLIQPLP